MQILYYCTVQIVCNFLYYLMVHILCYLIVRLSRCYGTKRNSGSVTVYHG